ncbi:MAG: hypothetical protein K0R38_2333 [Polyangiaceae bacterium]|jgi:hypothetical protein|nr:hypothetical protein [Polyangiaceae bacterium]
MLKLSRAGSWVLSLILSGAVFTACGSDDGKKNEPGRLPQGGEGGENSGDAGKAGSAGSSTAGSAGEPGAQGGAGDTGGTSGTAAGGGSEPTAGGNDAGGSSGAGGEGPEQPFSGLYIGVDGSDTAAGTEAAPFETLAKAASVAQPGDTIVFLDGTFPMSNQVVKIPAGVNVMAKNAGQANITSGTSAAVFELEGDSHFSGLKVTDAQYVLRFAGGVAAQGTVTIENSSFFNCTQLCLGLTGSASAVVLGSEGEVLGNGGQGFAIVSDTATISVSGGILRNYGSGAIFRGRGESSVSLSKVSFEGGTGPVLTLQNEAVGQLQDVKVAAASAMLFEQSNTSELIVTGSDIATSVTASNCFVVNDGKLLEIEGSKVHGCGTGVKSLLPQELRLSNSEFYDHSVGGADLSANGTRSVVIDGCKFYDSSLIGMRIGNGGTVLDLKMRDTSVDITSTANWHAIMLDGTNASTIDLGTLADPGGNTFLQRAASLSSAMRLQFQSVTIQAVGNTWTPSAQGANAQGKYVVSSGKVLEDATAANGINYVKPYTTAKIRLAEIP